MNTERLSKRLAIIAEEVPTQARMADIGTDHGYLPVYLAKQKKIKWAIAADVNKGPLHSAMEKIENEKLEDHIDTRMGNGLSVISRKDNIDTVVIAGMGGPLITTILEEGKSRLSTVKILILQPNVAAIEVRKWLLENNWQLTNENIVEEDNRIYEVLTAIPGDPRLPYRNLGIDEEAGLLFGPFLIQTQPTAFMKKWRQEQEKWKSIQKEMKKATSREEDILMRKKELERKLYLLEEVFSYESS